MRKLIYHHLPSIDSTNSWIKQQIRTLDKDAMTLATADCQTKGRGRRGRKWVSPPKQNLLASYCFFLPKGVSALFNITQIMAVSAAKALERLGFHPKLKWPNDILLSRKKVGGILCECISSGDKTAIIVGIGINIRMNKQDLEAIGQPATSLFLEGGRSVNVEDVLQLLSEYFLKDVEVYLEKGFQPFFSDYSARFAHHANQPLLLQENDACWEGVFHSLNADGSLSLLLPTGEVKRFYSGETLANYVI